MALIRCADSVPPHWSCDPLLVERIEDWEGLHCGPALIEGQSLHGVWYNRTLKYRADRRGKEIERDAWIQDFELELTPLPCWEHLSPEQRRCRAAEMIAEIEAKAAEERSRPVLGMARVQAQDYEDHPPKMKRSPAPFVHAGSKRIRQLYKAAYREFAELFQAASIALRTVGDLEAIFPRWSFPPALAFVRQGEDLTPVTVLAAQLG